MDKKTDIYVEMMHKPSLEAAVNYLNEENERGGFKAHEREKMKHCQEVKHKQNMMKGKK